jgi:glycosyltransferase involved in cell wall biosynthesis
MENSVAAAAGTIKRQEEAPKLCWHMITCEYPPQRGGVADYTQLLAAGLADCGDEVHVWCPAFPGPAPATGGVIVHREFGAFSWKDLQRVGEELGHFPGPRRLTVQWVPHGYGWKSMNVAFCWWLLQRARRCGDQVELMIHEPSLPFRGRSLRRNAAALVHRAMTILLLRAASRVWMSIPGWEPRLRPFAFGRELDFEWLPIFSSIPVTNNPSRRSEIRQQYAGGDGRLLIGHFGTFGASITDLLERILVNLAQEDSKQVFLLLGDQSEPYRERLTQRHPGLATRVHATGQLPAEELSSHLAACDLLIQPYPDGVSSRRTSFMAGLAHGKPMVTTEGELTESLWRGQDGVFLAAPGDTRNFVEKVRHLASRPAERLRAGLSARKLYEQRFASPHLIGTLRKAAQDEPCHAS